MRGALLSMTALTLLAAAPAYAELSVSSGVVKSGYFQAPDCSPTMDPKAFNECICHAEIKKPQVLGGATDALINAKLALLPQKLADESCEGTPTTAPQGGLKVNTATADYVVAYQSPTTLTILTTYATYGAGSDHPLEGTEGFTFDLASGELVDPVLLLKPEQLKKADAFIKQELAKKYPTALHEEARARTEPYLTENGCDSCTLFYAKEGWMVRFQLESIAPYMTGEPEVALPAEIIPPPETLIGKK